MAVPVETSHMANLKKPPLLKKLDLTSNTGVKSSVANHHDIFFKSFFSDPKMAFDILKLVFTKRELGLFNFKKLKNEKDSFPEKRADLVFSVPFKTQVKFHVKIFIILEHKSRYDSRLFSQLLYYQTYLHRQTIEQYGRPMPIVPVVFYHGRRSWIWKKSFQEVFWPQAQGLKNSIFDKKNVLDYRIKLLDLQNPKLRNVLKKVSSLGTGSRVAMHLMREAWRLKKEGEGQKKEILRSVLPSLENLGGGRYQGDELLLSMVEYVMALGVSKNLWEEMEREALECGFLKKGGVMNIREYIEQKGVQKGIQKGIQEGWQKGQQEGRKKTQQDLILKMLKEKADLSFISKITGFSEQEIKKLKSNSKK